MASYCKGVHKAPQIIAYLTFSIRRQSLVPIIFIVQIRNHLIPELHQPITIKFSNTHLNKNHGCSVIYVTRNLF